MDQRRVDTPAQPQRVVLAAMFADIVQHLGQCQFDLGDHLLGGAAIESFAQKGQCLAHGQRIGAENPVQHGLAPRRNLTQAFFIRSSSRGHQQAPFPA